VNEERKEGIKERDRRHLDIPPEVISREGEDITISSRKQ